VTDRAQDLLDSAAADGGHPDLPMDHAVPTHGEIGLAAPRNAVVVPEEVGRR
jgi:hypothetical protein